jgi:sulfhydrogenase subunit alpha
MSDKKIDVELLCRVEGHGGIYVEYEKSKLKKIEMRVTEGTRFFESFLKGRRFEDVPEIASRICAICSVSHNLTAHMAIEDALGVQVTPQTLALRELLYNGEYIESHSLHVYALAAPDLLGYTSAISMAKDHPEVVKMALDMKKLGNYIMEVVGGRAIHPNTVTVGGFSKLPSNDQLWEIRDWLVTALEYGMKITDVLATLTLPVLSDNVPYYVATVPWNKRYGWMGNSLGISDKTRVPVKKYKSVTNEFMIDHSNAKWSQYKGKPIMVGALARLNLFHEMISSRAQNYPRTMECISKLGFEGHSDNILYNNWAQQIENIYAIEDSIWLIDQILTSGINYDEPLPAIEVKAGIGYACSEAPRGTLIHSYELDEQGRVVTADVITPTAMNWTNIEEDLRQAATKLAAGTAEEIQPKLEIVARAYDPCISCSVHLVEVVKK